MENIPLVALCISSALSFAALVISSLSLWNARKARRNSQDAQHHTQIVSFEQRKQELRQMFLEEQLMVVESESELKRFSDSEWRREKFSQLTDIRRQNDTFLKDLDRIPSSPSTEARLKLEGLAGKVITANKSMQILLKVLRDAKQTIEQTRRDTSK